MDHNPFDDHEAHAEDNDRAIPTTATLIPGQRPPSDLPKIPKQPTPEER
jgi:hypothetical protein